MKVIEILNFNRELLKRLQAAGIRLEDARYIDLYLMARQIELPLKSITLFLGNVHIYENNIPGTRALLAGDETVRFGLNV
ncbi:hypothetical protein [Butyricimonas paravirosa]|uniref:hypothetical protein n=1 Tax=Butyricimonas paravirosa TaxID=1472417 RepID=UPI00351F8765